MLLTSTTINFHVRGLKINSNMITFKSSAIDRLAAPGV